LKTVDDAEHQRRRLLVEQLADREVEPGDVRVRGVRVRRGEADAGVDPGRQVRSGA